MSPEMEFFHRFFLILFILVALYSVYQLVFVQKMLGDRLISKPYRCFTIATIFLTLWGINRLIICLFGVSGSLLLILQYGLGHSFMFVAIIFIFRAAIKTRELYIGYKDLNDDRRP